MRLNVLLNKIIPNYPPSKLLNIDHLRELYTTLSKYLTNLSVAELKVTEGELLGYYEEIVDDDKEKKRIVLEEVISQFLHIEPTTKEKTLKTPKKIKNIKPKKKNGELSCLGEYNIIKVLGEGQYGKVYLVNNGKKKYALKEQVIDISSSNKKFIDTSINAIIKEIDLSKLMGKHRIGPKIYDSYMCKTKTQLSIYIVMEHMNKGSFADFLQNYISKPEYIMAINKKIKKMHTFKIMHLDLHQGNILVNEKKKNKFEFYIADFGLSKTFKEFIDRNKDNELSGSAPWSFNTNRKHDELIIVTMMLLEVI